MLRLKHKFLATILAILIPACSLAATVGSDGGVTIWLSFDDSVSGPIDVDDTVSVTEGTSGIATCGGTDTGRSGVGAAASAGQCPGGAASCLAREKLEGDLTRFSEYVFQATEGETYIRRVFVADEGRSWDTSDVRYDLTTAAGSTGAGGGWDDVGRQINLRNAERRCIHDVLHHEFGHYFHALPDRYRSDESNGYYRGTLNGSATFDVGVEERDINTVMSNNFPHLFVDTTNARIAVEYDPPGATDVNHPPGEVLTPDLLSDADPDNDGPDRDHHGHTHPFAQDEWSRIPLEHAHLSGVHTEGTFPNIDLATMPAPDIVFIGDDAPAPGTMLVLDRSGSMSVQTDGIAASQYVQEAGLYLYHSSQSDDFVGTVLYNDSVETLFDYELYDPANSLPQASFRVAQGLTNIALSLETAIDALVAEHGMGGANGSNIVLMSDGRQTTGPDLWDEVDRANMLGIRINTISFGNADAPTMAQIATDTGGDQTDASERGDAFELKMGMAREFSEIRGYTPIYLLKEPLKKKGVKGRVQFYEDQFVVPRHSRDLMFYSFLDGGDASRYDLELIDPAGNVFTGTADSIASRGRFNGVKNSKPEPGVWTYRILGTRGTDFAIPSDQPFELTAYARNLTLDTTIGLTFDDAPAGFTRILGNVSFRYPLTKLKARAHIYRGGKALGWIELFDDGVNGGDTHAGDGEFSGLLDLRQFDLTRPRGEGITRSKTRIDGQFVIGDSTTPAPNAHYETGTIIKNLMVDYEKNGKNRLPFEAWASTTFDFTSQGKKQDDGASIRILKPGKQIKIRPGDEDKIVVAVSGLQPRKSTLRYSLGHDIEIKLDEIQTSENLLGGIVTFVYSVDKDAREGPRDLLLQIGSEVLRLNNVLFVAH